MNHSFLGPSSAHIWLECAPAMRLAAVIHPEEQDNDYVKEGAMAHAVNAEVLTTGTFVVSSTYTSDPLFSRSMIDYALEYQDFIEDLKNKMQNAKILIEEELDLSDFIPCGIGTVDSAIMNSTHLHVIDYKYGAGVRVEAQDNPQMKIYALGIIKKYKLKPLKITLTIFQPRINQISSWDIELEELNKWAINELKPKANKAYMGRGETKQGDHCRFCKAKSLCKKHYETMKTLSIHDPRLMTEDEVVEVLNKADSIKAWLNSVQEYALKEAVEKQRSWGPYKLTQGKGRREIKHQDILVQKLVKEDYPMELITERKMIGIIALERILGKHKFDKLVKPFIRLTEGKKQLKKS